MGRRKVQHELIPNETSRRTTFKKRRVGLLKKLKEITTLCGVIACGIIFNSFGNGRGKHQGQDQKPEVWPSVPEAAKILRRLKGLPENKQKKYMLDNESLLGASLGKTREVLRNEVERNRMLELGLLLLVDEEGGIGLKGKCEILDEMIEMVVERIEELRGYKEGYK